MRTTLLFCGFCLIGLVTFFIVKCLFEQDFHRSLAIAGPIYSLSILIWHMKNKSFNNKS